MDVYVEIFTCAFVRIFIVIKTGWNCAEKMV